MRKALLALIGGLMIGAFAASHAQSPAPAPKSDAEKAAEAQKAAAAKAKAAEDLGKAQDRAAANYKKNKGMSMDAPAKAAKKK